MNRILQDVKLPGGRRLRLVAGDITAEAVDAIVNAANSHLQHGGGVAGAIVRKGGRIIQEESNAIGFVPVGRAAMTGAGSLPAGYVIHAVGPRWGEGEEDAKLASAVRNSLQLAAEKGFNSVSLPAISSGIFGFPKDRCARIILETIQEFLEENPEGRPTEVRLCIIDQPTIEVFEAEFRQQFGGD